MSQLADKARSVVRDLDPSNDMTFLRVRSKKHEIMVAPDKDFILIVIQNPTDWMIIIPLCIIKDVWTRQKTNILFIRKTPPNAYVLNYHP